MNTVSNKSVAIIGAGLGGLSAGLHLRQAGFNVRIFEANSRIGGRANRIERNGFTFDTGPTLLNYPWVFEQLFSVAGHSFADEVPLIHVDPSITFFWRNGKHLSLSSVYSRFLKEIERFEDGAGLKVASFFEATSERYRIAFEKLVTKNANNPLQWFGNLSVKDYDKLSLFSSFDRDLKRNFASSHVREALGSYAMYLGGSPFDLPGMYSILPYGELAYGLWFPKGGMHALIEKIGSIAIDAGIKISCSTPVKRIVVKNGLCVGLTTEDNSFHPFDFVVSNVDVSTTELELLKDAGITRRKTVPMTCGVVTFYWGVRKHVTGLPHHNIFFPDEYKKSFRQLTNLGEFPDDIPFYVSIPSKTDSSLAPEGCDAVFVLVPAPLISQSGDVDWSIKKAEIKQQVIRRLTLHGANLTADDIVTEEVWTPLDWSKNFGLYDGSAFGATHTLFNVGPFRKNNYDKEIQGLYYVGASTVPGTGMPMVAISGAMTAERIIRHVC